MIYLPRDIHKEWNQLKKRCILQAAELEGMEPANPFETEVLADLELQGLVFALLHFSLILVQYYLIIPSLFFFITGTYILCHCILDICNFFLFNRYPHLRRCF